jgi:hypothetical protein
VAHPAFPAAAEPTGGAEQEPTPMAREFGLKDVAPRMSIHGFADVTAFAYFDHASDGTSSSENYFALGELNLFIVSHLADNLSFVAEVVFESGTENDFSAEVERFLIKYTVSDKFWFSLGRHHTALGYWNEAFHHGLLLQPTIARPEGLKFEDHGGILPVHSVGIAMGGRAFRGPWGFEYCANIGNGRGVDSHDVQTAKDLNDQKSITLRLTGSHETSRRILFGPMIHLDRIPADPTIPGREGEMTERIYGAFATYLGERFELISEYYHVRHEDLLTRAVFTSPTYFLTAVWNTGKLKPYAAYDRLDLDRADPFYDSEITALKRILAGVRWDINSFNAIKFELRHDARPGVHSNGLAIQSAFTF